MDTKNWLVIRNIKTKETIGFKDGNLVSIPKNGYIDLLIKDYSMTKNFDFGCAVEIFSPVTQSVIEFVLLYGFQLVQVYDFNFGIDSSTECCYQILSTQLTNLEVFKILYNFGSEKEYYL